MNFEQLTIGKGGVVGVFGNCNNEIKWCTIMADFLLGKMLSSRRYEYVHCINLDRKNTDIINLSKKYDPIGKKLRITERKYLLDSSGHLNSVLVLESCKAKGKISSSSSCTYGVILYSFSELLVAVGWKNASNFLRQILAVGESRVDDTDPTDTASSSMNRERPCIILVINESLHTPLILAQIQRFLFTFARTIPNTGTLSTEVVCEIQTIRKSSVTGKVAEGIDMFSYLQNCLQLIMPLDRSALLPIKVGENDDPVDETQKKSSANMLIQEMGKNTIASAQEISRSSTSTGAVNVMQRLITFENTDPEFDEDSDPDADLDL